MKHFLNLIITQPLFSICLATRCLTVSPTSTLAPQLRCPLAATGDTHNRNRRGYESATAETSVLTSKRNEHRTATASQLLTSNSKCGSRLTHDDSKQLLHRHETATAVTSLLIMIAPPRTSNRNCVSIVAPPRTSLLIVIAPPRTIAAPQGFLEESNRIFSRIPRFLYFL